MNPVEIEDLLTARFLSSIQITPDGEQPAFVVKRANVEKGEYASDLQPVDLDGGAKRRLTGAGKNGESDHMAEIFPCVPADATTAWMDGRIRRAAVGGDSP